MLALWGALSIVVLGFSFYLWPRDQRSLKTVIITGAIISSLTALGILIAKSIPITRKETVEKVVVLKYKKPPQIVYRDRPVFVEPGKGYEPVDTASACKGDKTIEVDEITVSGKDDDKDTWILGHPVGSHVQITCRVPGSYDDFWHKGSLIQLPDNGSNK